MKALRRLFYAALAIIAVVWLFVPREPVDTVVSFDPGVLSGDLDAYLAAAEAEYDDITEGVQKQIIWAGAPGEQTDLAIVYVHGFSATLQEIRPVPDDLAKRFGANLFYTRLSGHGRGALAMAEPVAGDWIEDTAEALAIGRKLGREVIVVATSTGGTLAAIAATDPAQMERVKGLAMISPNFRVQSPAAVILEWPLARVWGLAAAGAERSLDPQNEGHAKYWTMLYPTTALVPMAALVRYARRLDYGTVRVPALFVFSDDDAVVAAEATRAISTRWGGPVQLEPRVLGEGDDPFHHVLAGDILSPGQTEATVDLIATWIEGL